MAISGRIVAFIAWLDHSRQKTDVGGKQGLVSRRKNFVPTNHSHEKNKPMTPVPASFYIGRRCKEFPISNLNIRAKCHGIRFGFLDVENLCRRKKFVKN